MSAGRHVYCNGYRNTEALSLETDNMQNGTLSLPVERPSTGRLNHVNTVSRYPTRKKRGCCGYLTCLEACLVWIVLLLLGLLLGGAATWAVLTRGFQEPWPKPSTTGRSVAYTQPPATTVPPVNQEYCMSQECVIFAAHLLRNMDLKKDPCNQFYDFVCGEYIKRHELPGDRAAITPLHDLEGNLYAHMKEIFDVRLPSDAPPSHQMAHRFYQSCMDDDAAKDEGAKPLMELLDSLGGWPILTADWEERIRPDFSWARLAGSMLRELGRHVTLDVYVSPDGRNSTYQLVEIDAPEIKFIAQEHFLNGSNPEYMEKYLELMVETAVVLGANRTEQLDVEMRKALDFEIETASITLPKELRRNRTTQYNGFKLRDLYDRYPTLDLRTYIVEAFPRELNITEDEFIVVVDPHYLKGLDTLVEKTDARTIANHMFWIVVRDYIKVMPPPYRDPSDNFRKFLTGSLSVEQRWKECIIMAIEYFPMITGALYATRHLSEHVKHQVEMLTTDVHQAFMNELKTISWMDEKTRQRALTKAEKMHKMIGYPKEVHNETWLFTRYEDLTITSDQFLANIVALEKRNTYNQMSGLRLLSDKDGWMQSPAQVDAYYAPNNNHIVFAAGILQFPFYTPGLPAYINYASLGNVIGHEITHGFDDLGKQHNEEGNLENWWDDETAKHFARQAKCFEDQYGSIMVPEAGTKLNGRITLGENIADNGGVKTAFKAYQILAAKQNSSEPRLPGFQNFTTEQMFFIAYTTNWCGVIRNESYSYYISTENHSPFRYRALLPLQNFDEFSKAFQCLPGTDMNPKTKCEIW